MTSSSNKSSSSSSSPSKQQQQQQPPANKNNNNKAKSSSDKAIIEEQLDKALLSLEHNQISTYKLFTAWRTQLFRLSLGVFLLVIVSFQRPTTTCLKTIIKLYNSKIINDDNTLSDEIPFLDAVKYAIEDSLMEFLSVICCGCLVWMLHENINNNHNMIGGSGGSNGIIIGDFATVWYRMSCALLPGILTLYYQQRQRQQQNNSSGGSSIQTCLPPTIMTEVDLFGSLDDDESDNDILLSQAQQQHQQQQLHGFPVVVIFHFIMSLAIWFMKYQEKQNQTSINKILKLKQELLKDKKEQ